METGHIKRYLRHKLPETEGLKVVKLHRTYPGMSRETWLADVQWSQEGQVVQRGFVFRMDTPGGSVCPTPLRREYEVYRRLQSTPVPVPTTFWYETDPAWLPDGREFYVREKVEGSIDIPHLYDPDPQYDALRMAVAKEHVEKLAALHTVDWRQLGFGEVMEVPPDEASCARFNLELWEDIFDHVRVEAFPAVRDVLCWLKDHEPPPPPRISLIKGNNGVGEELWQGTRIVAMCDWELAQVGDPAEDWCWMQLNARMGRQGIDTSLFDEQRLLEHYEEISGFHLAPESLQFYQMVQLFKKLVCIHSAARMFVTGKDMRVAVAGMPLMAFIVEEQLARAVWSVD